MIPVTVLMPIIALAAALLVRWAAGIARRVALLDIPNERSSHKVPVPRMGGAAFVPVMFGGLLCGWSPDFFQRGIPASFFWGAATLYCIALVDDIWSVNAPIRLACQFFSAAVFLAGVSAYQPFVTSWPVFVVCAIWIVGVVNIYNFMDGIDGMAGVQGVAAGVGWLMIGIVLGTPATLVLGGCAAAASAGFLTLNWYPARIFMGDAGSTVLGYCFASAPFLAWAELGGRPQGLKIVFVALLLIWPFLADGIFTILRRMRNGENVLLAHRSHLYQRLVIAGNSPQRVTLVYGGMAAIGAVLGWFVVIGEMGPLFLAAGLVSVCFFGLWCWTQTSERKSFP